MESNAGMFLWIWLLGAPLVAAVIDRMAIGKSRTTSERYASGGQVGSGHVRSPV